MRELRETIKTIGAAYHLQCMKSTGDGYLLTYRDPRSAELSAIHAIDASLRIIEVLNTRNEDESTAQERKINVRIAVHFGQVDVVDNDREGPDVSYAFRLEGITRESLRSALNSVAPGELPLQNYIVCSEPVRGILGRHGYAGALTSLGLLRFKGFHDWHEVFLLGGVDATPTGETSQQPPSLRS